MDLERLETGDYDDVLALYRSAFPPDERRDYADAGEMEAFVKAHKGEFGVYGLKRDGALLAFVTVWHLEGCLYVEHLAVQPTVRGEGLGSAILESLTGIAELPVLLEVELPETEEARRRIRFYGRNGFRTRPETEYMQPPYSPGKSPVPLLLMTRGELDLSGGRVVADLKHRVYGA